MDEVEKYCQILGLDETCSPAELDAAYQERARAWQPENFAGNAALQLKARQKLEHVNAAHEFLRANLFRPTAQAKPAPALVRPTPLSDWKPEPLPPAPRNRPALFAGTAALLLLILAVAALLLCGTDW